MPYPTSEEERERWRHSNEDDPEETWDPDRLDELLRVLGSQKVPSPKGPPLAFTIPWDEHKWQYERQRLKAANIITQDSYYTTRQILSMDDEIPDIVEAVAAYPSAKVAVDDLQLHLPIGEEDGIELEAVAAVIARPLLLPDLDDDPEKALQEAVLVARDEAFRKARGEYHDWVRKFLAPIRRKDAGAKTIDAASIKLAQIELGKLIEAERAAVSAHAWTKRWNRVVQGVALVGLGLATAKTILDGGDYLSAAQLGTSAVGLIAGHLSQPEPDRGELTGGSMFVTSKSGLTWLH
ncbi:MAG: hypothetical protein GY938_10525 [Ketobacter sp.]|nr:hypothetical protein [Ketobacter sp.]